MTPQGVLRWAVKPSFVHYVRMIAAGSCDVRGGAEIGADGAFEFPVLRVVESPDGWTLSFQGSVHFSAHRGYLDVNIGELCLEFTPDGGALSIATSSGGRSVIANTAPARPTTADAVLRWSQLVPTLTQHGVAVFGDVYPSGTELSPIDITLTLHS